MKVFYNTDKSYGIKRVVYTNDCYRKEAEIAFTTEDIERIFAIQTHVKEKTGIILNLDFIPVKDDTNPNKTETVLQFKNMMPWTESVKKHNIPSRDFIMDALKDFMSPNMFNEIKSPLEEKPKQNPLLDRVKQGTGTYTGTMHRSHSQPNIPLHL